MDKDGTNVVALVGLTNHDLALFKSIAKLSSVREPRYRVAESPERNTANIFVINGDDLFAVREAQNLMGDRRVGQIHVRKELKGATSFITLVHPLRAKDVIAALDNVARV